MLKALLDDLARPGETRELALSKPAHERPHPHYEEPPRYDLPVRLTPGTGELKIDVNEPIRVTEDRTVQTA